MKANSFPFIGDSVIECGREVMQWADASDDDTARIGTLCDNLLDAWDERTPDIYPNGFNPRLSLIHISEPTRP